MTTFSLKLEGKSLEHAYDSAELYKNLQDILTKYTLQLQRDIVTNTPVDTGFLSSRIYPFVEGLIGRVTPVDEATKYAPFVEYDTAPHVIRAKNAPYLHFKVMSAQGIKFTDSGVKATGKNTYGWVRVKEVHHPGTKGAHMFEQGIENVDTDAMIEEISAALGAAWAD